MSIVRFLVEGIRMRRRAAEEERGGDSVGHGPLGGKGEIVEVAVEVSYRRRRLWHGRSVWLVGCC